MATSCIATSFTSMDKRVESVLDNIVQKISGDTISGFMNKSLFGADVPMIKWSLLNQLACFLAGTQDARGYRQWQKVGRYVKRGKKAIWILAPNMGKIKQSRKEEVEINGLIEKVEREEEVQKLFGFKTVPVFRYEDTDGKPLEYEQRIQKIDPEKLPLYAVAQNLGVTVQVGQTTRGEYGSFSPSAKQIRLCSDSEQTFLHEISHAVDQHLGNYKDYESGEIVAELSACFLASLYSLKADIGETQEYIKSWSKGRHVGLAIGNALHRVKAIYKYIEKWKEIKTA